MELNQRVSKLNVVTPPPLRERKKNKTELYNEATEYKILRADQMFIFGER